MFKHETQVIKFLLQWYSMNARKLPWRKKNNLNLPHPYFVFVSEYMLQQTTVNTVKNKFNEFILKWPSLNKLAQTSEPNILKFWSGLGYYSRARNLLKAAKIINKNYKSEIPNKYEDLIMLPGIGDYTAKAILGIGYNESVMPLDANIERILARLYALNKPLIKIKQTLSENAQLFLSKKHSSNLIQSFMDYGSIICTPRNPNCSICGINKYCLSYQKKIQNTIPVKIKKTKSKPKKFSRAYILINEKNEILVRKRASKGMLASMLEVPNDEWVEKKSLLRRDEIAKTIERKLIRKGDFSYSFSHFDLNLEIFYKKIRKIDYPKNKWLNIKKYSNSQLPTVMKKVLEIMI